MASSAIRRIRSAWDRFVKVTPEAMTSRTASSHPAREKIKTIAGSRLARSRVITVAGRERKRR